MSWIFTHIIQIIIKTTGSSRSSSGTRRVEQKAEKHQGRGNRSALADIKRFFCGAHTRARAPYTHTHTRRHTWETADCPCDTWDTSEGSQWMVASSQDSQSLDAAASTCSFPTFSHSPEHKRWIESHSRQATWLPPTCFIFFFRAPIVASSFTTSPHPKAFHFGHIELEPVGQFAADPLDFHLNIHTAGCTLKVGFDDFKFTRQLFTGNRCSR